MAEGGYDETGTFPGGEGETDESAPLRHHHDGDEGMEMKERTSTPFSSTSRQRWQHFEETSFGGTPSGVMEMRTEAVDELKKVFQKPDTSKFYAEIGSDGGVFARLKGDRNILYPILKNGEVLFNKDGKYIDDNGNVMKNKYGKEIIVAKIIRDALGKTVIEIMDEKRMANERAEKRIKELREQRENAIPDEQARIDERIKVYKDGIEMRNQEIEAIEERLPLKQRIKEIFKKYGFTVIAVATAIATVIGVIVSNLKAGLTKVAKGVGNGLKELGAKLGEILPGMIGAIASFIFRTAREVIGFLAKNAWLLVVGLVLLAVEQLKNKK